MEQPKKDDVSKKNKYIISQMPSNYEPIITSTDGQEMYTVLDALAKIMNDIDEIKKVLK